jgi:acyl-[acyl-carrier-protein] desaturase
VLLARRAAQLLERPSPQPLGDDRPLTDRSVLRVVQAPALVVAQEDDPLHRLDVAADLAAALPGSTGLLRLPAVQKTPPAPPSRHSPTTSPRRTRDPLAGPVRRLTEQLATSLDLHLSRAVDWLPHEYVPWSQGRDFGDAPWDVSQSALSQPVRAAVTLNLLTEDNLPGYHGTLARLYGDQDPWRTWLDRWTAEEGRHAIVLRDYLVVTRAVDPVALEADRMATVSGGYRAPEKDLLRAVVYVAFQELATRVAHRATGRLSGDAGLDALLRRVAADENLHMVLYRDLVQVALDVDPAATLAAVVDEVAGFEMPGTGIPGFVRRAAVVARAGIYDLRVHRDDVVLPMLRYWRVFERDDLPPEAERQRDRLAAVVAELDRRVARLASRRQLVGA